jgi:hypothetical protein
MDIAIFGLFGLAFTAAILAKIVHERRLDVLYGPYIQGRARERPGLSALQYRKSADLAIDRLLSLEGPKRERPSSIFAC